MSYDDLYDHKHYIIIQIQRKNSFQSIHHMSNCNMNNYTCQGKIKFDYFWMQSVKFYKFKAQILISSVYL